MPNSLNAIPDWAKEQLQGQVGLEMPDTGVIEVGGQSLAAPVKAPEWASRMARQSSLLMVGGPDARMAMFPDEFEGDRPNVFERGARQIIYGASQMIPSAMTLAGGVMEFLGADKAGAEVAGAGISLQDWLTEHVAVENPTFYDHLMSGFGTMATFIIPGIGAAGMGIKGARALGLVEKTVEGAWKLEKGGAVLSKLGRAFQTITQSGTMAFVESAVEQSQRQSELIQQGMTPAEALAASQDVFWQNMVLLTATNAPFFSPARRVTKGLMSAVSEGAQERAQSVIQDVASGRGEWKDFLDPGKYGTETAIGAIIGGAVGTILPQESGQKDKKKKTLTLKNREIAPENYPETDEQVRKMDLQRREEDIKKDVAATSELELEHFEAMRLLEQGLIDEYGVDIDLGDRLSPQQFAELAKAARAATEEQDRAKQWDMEQKAIDLAKEFLFKDQSIVPTGKLGEAQLEKDVDKFIEEEQKKTDQRVTEEVAAVEGAAGAPDISGFVKQEPTAREKEIFAAREQKKKEYWDQKNKRKNKPVVAEEPPVQEKTPEPVAEAVAPIEKSENPVEAVKRLAKDDAARGEVENKTQGEALVKTEIAGKAAAVIPIEQINTDTETFQARTESLDEEFVQNAVDNFDEQAVQPIEIWKDPATGKYMVLDGHHTLEILKRVGKKAASVKIFEGTREEAIKRSEVANDMRRGNDLISQAKTLRSDREAGMSKKDLNNKAKVLYRENKSTVVALSHLNHKGKVMDAIKSLAKSPDALGKALQYARWIGNARAKYPTLTDQHEREMWDYLEEFGNKASLTNESAFDDIVQSRSMMGSFEGIESMNLRKTGVSKGNQASYDRQINDLNNEKAALKRELAKEKKAYEERVKSSTDEAETTRLNDAIARIESRFGEQIDATEDEINKLKKEWRAAQDAGIDQSIMFMYRSVNDSMNEAKRFFNLKSLKQVNPKDGHSKFVNRLAKMLGVKVVFVEADEKLGGYYDPMRQDTVFINVENDSPMMFLFGHELMHLMKNNHPEQWSDILNVASETVPKEVRDKYYKELPFGYKYSGQSTEEFMGDLVGTAMTREIFWTKLRGVNEGAFSNLVDIAMSFIKSVRAAFKKMSFQNRRIDKDFSSFSDIENEIVAALGKIQYKEKMNAPVDPNQYELFGLVEPPGRTSLMQEKIAKLRRAERGQKDRLRVSWRDMPRLFYKKMVDKNTYLYTGVKAQLDAIGVKWSEYEFYKNPYKVLQKATAWTAKATFALKHGVYSWDGKTKMSDGLQQIIKEFGLASPLDTGEFGQFMIASRLISMHEVLGDKFFTGTDEELGVEMWSPEATEAKAEFDDWVKLHDEYSKLEPTWAKAVDAMTKWSNSVMKRLLQSGMISQEEYDRIVEKYDVYAPLFVIEKETPTPGNVVYEMDRLIPGLNRMDPIEGMIKNAYRLEFLNARNNANMAAADFIKDIAGGEESLPGFGRRITVDDDPVAAEFDREIRATGQSVEELGPEAVADIQQAAKMSVVHKYGKEGVVAFMRDSEMEYWTFEKDILDVYQNAFSHKSHELMKYWTTQTTLLRAGAVLTPEFMARNQTRDFMAVGVISKHLVNNPKDALLLPVRIMRGLGHMIKKDEIYKDFIMDDAGHANLVSPDQEELRIKSEELARASSGEFRLKQFKKNPVKYMLHSHPITLLQELGKLTENSTRLAVYEKTLDSLIAEGVDPREARAQASSAAREDSVDFSRAGEYGAIINRIVPFFNAAVQGNDKLFRTLLRDEGNRKATWLRGVSMITIPSLLLWMVNHDEEWYKEQPMWLKNGFWLFSVDGGKTIHKIPKPFEVGLIFGSLPERFMDWAIDKDPKAAKSWIDQYRDSIMLLDPAQLLGPMGVAANEIRSNYDAFRKTPIVKGWLEDVAPKDQFTSNTSEFSKWLGSVYPGRGLSPLMIDHFIRGAFGGLGQWGADAASNAVMAIEPDRRKIKPASRRYYGVVPDWTPVIKAFSSTTPTKYGRYQSDFYKEYDRAREAMSTFRAYKSGGATKDQFVDLYRREGVYLAMYKPLAKAARGIGMVSRQMRIIELADPSVLTRKQKRTKLDELMKARNQMFKKFMEKFYSVDFKALQKRVDKSADAVGRAYEK